MTTLSVFDRSNKIVWAQFSTNTHQGSKEYRKNDKRANNYQAKLCKLLRTKDDSKRIGTHINIFNEVPKNRILQ